MCKIHRSWIERVVFLPEKLGLRGNKSQVLECSEHRQTNKIWWVGDSKHVMAEGVEICTMADHYS